MEFSFMGGSMGSVVGEKITRTLTRGLERKIPVVIVSVSEVLGCRGDTVSNANGKNFGAVKPNEAEY